MANHLKHLRISEISLVDKGASGNGQLRPKVLIAKRADQAPEKGKPMSFFAKIFGKSPVAKELPDLMTMLDEAMASLPEAKQAELKPLLVALMQGAPHMQKPAPAPKPETETPAEKVKEGEMKPEEMAKAFEAKLGEAVEKISKAADEKITKAMADKDGEIKKLRDELTAEKVEKRKVEIAKRAGDLKALPGKTDELVKTLEEVESKAGSAATDALIKRLADANRLIGKSRVLHTGAGVGPGGDEIEGSVVGKVAKAIGETMEAVEKTAGAKPLTREQAFEKVWKGLTVEERREYADETNPERASA